MLVPRRVLRFGPPFSVYTPLSVCSPFWLSQVLQVRFWYWKRTRTRRTTGARGCNFLTSFEQFWIILNFIEPLFDLSWSISIYLGLSCSFSGYFWFSWAISGHLVQYQAIFDCLGLSWVHPAISGYFWLSLASSVYLLLSWAISGYLWLSLAISGYIGLNKIISSNLGPSRSISGYLWLSQAITGYLRLSPAISGYRWITLAISDYLYISYQELGCK